MKKCVVSLALSAHGGNLSSLWIGNHLGMGWIFWLEGEGSSIGGFARRINLAFAVFTNFSFDCQMITSLSLCS